MRRTTAIAGATVLFGLGVAAPAMAIEPYTPADQGSSNVQQGVSTEQVTKVAQNTASPSLARTGSDIGVAAAVGAGFLVAGGVLVTLRRRGRQEV